MKLIENYKYLFNCGSTQVLLSILVAGAGATVGAQANTWRLVCRL
jgi:hypothetical protein